MNPDCASTLQTLGRASGHQDLLELYHFFQELVPSEAEGWSAFTKVDTTTSPFFSRTPE